MNPEADDYLHNPDPKRDRRVGLFLLFLFRCFLVVVARGFEVCIGNELCVGIVRGDRVGEFSRISCLCSCETVKARSCWLGKKRSLKSVELNLRLSGL